MSNLTTDVLRVRSDTDPGKLGKSIAANLTEVDDGKVDVRAMGGSAVFQAAKGLSFADELLREKGMVARSRVYTDVTPDDLSVTVFEVRLYEL